METLRFSFSEKVALTYSEGQIVVWEPSEYTTDQGWKLFKNSRGSAILRSDNGYWWKYEKKEAPNCWYGQYWMGDYPYGSWCWAIRVCKVTGEVKVTSIETDINPRGLSTSDLWIRECQSYAPEVVCA